MNYRYRNFDFLTECKEYRVLSIDSSSPFTKECRGICTIYYPKSLGGTNRPTSHFQLITFTYSSDIFRLKSLDPISITILELSDLNDSLIIYKGTSITLISSKVTRDLVRKALLDSGYFDLMSGTDKEFHYHEVLNLLVNKSIKIDDTPSNPKSLIDTKIRYLLDFTHCMYALYNTLEVELSKQGFYLKNLYETEEVKTREVATLQFDEFSSDLFKLNPSYNNDVTSYRTHGSLILNTTSQSKFERLQNDFISLKFISNTQRIYCEDLIHNIWTSNLKWDSKVDTNSPQSAENDKNESSYYLKFNFEYEYYVIRNDKYSIIRNLLLQVANLDSESYISLNSNVKLYKL